MCFKLISKTSFTDTVNTRRNLKVLSHDVRFYPLHFIRRSYIFYQMYHFSQTKLQTLSLSFNIRPKLPSWNAHIRTIRWLHHKSLGHVGWDRKHVFCTKLEALLFWNKLQVVACTYTFLLFFVGVELKLANKLITLSLLL